MLAGHRVPGRHADGAARQAPRRPAGRPARGPPRVPRRRGRRCRWRTKTAKRGVALELVDPPAADSNHLDDDAERRTVEQPHHLVGSVAPRPARLDRPTSRQQHRDLALLTARPHLSDCRAPALAHSWHRPGGPNRHDPSRYRAAGHHVLNPACSWPSSEVSYQTGTRPRAPPALRPAAAARRGTAPATGSGHTTGPPPTVGEEAGQARGARSPESGSAGSAAARDRRCYLETAPPTSRQHKAGRMTGPLAWPIQLQKQHLGAAATLSLMPWCAGLPASTPGDGAGAGCAPATGSTARLR